jgi:hypothetical protein
MNSLHGSSWAWILARGLLWAIVYNVVWGVAWGAFMHREWDAAAAAIHQPSPWAPAVWLVWGVITVPIGMAIIAYAVRRPRARQAAAAAGVAVWLLFSAGMTINGLRSGFSIRVLALDALVNLIAIEAASLAVGRRGSGH